MRQASKAVRRHARRPSIKQPATRSPAAITVIESERDVATAMLELRRLCPVLKGLHERYGDPPLRRREGGFAGLARIIVGQQVSVASANAIWARFAAGVVPMTAAAIAGMSDDALRGCGLSRPKVKTFRAITAAIEAGLDLSCLASIDVEAARTSLLEISGIGPWTADIYLMFCVGRADVFAPGDLALQVAAQMALGLEARPTAMELAAIAERWQPYRSAAAWMLWSYYAALKAEKSGAPV